MFCEENQWQKIVNSNSYMAHIMACKTGFFQNLQHLPVIYSILSIQVFYLQRIQLE